MVLLYMWLLKIINELSLLKLLSLTHTSESLQTHDLQVEEESFFLELSEFTLNLS